MEAGREERQRLEHRRLETLHSSLQHSAPPQRLAPSAPSPSETRTDALVVFWLFAWLAATAWVRPLSLPDEGRYAGVAWEMLWSGNWLIPTIDTLPYFHKPPLFYWLATVALALFGVNEWAARLTSLLAATGTAFAVYLFARRWSNAAAARITLIVLATTPLFYGCAQFANLDMLVSACITCTILCAANAVFSADSERPHRLSLAGAYFFAALGVLAKGLIGAVIPAIVLLAWLISLGRSAVIVRLISLPGLALFTLIVVPWFALMHARYPGFLEYFFVHHHLERFSAHGFNNERAFWFYLPVFFGLTLPWSVFLATAIHKQRNAGGLRPEVRVLMWIWLAAVVVFFSIPSSKLVGYVLPAVPPLAVLVAHRLAGLGGGFNARSWVLRTAAVAALLCLAALVGAALHERTNIKGLAAMIRPQLGNGDHVIALGHYPFSASFYLRLRRPIGVVERWDDLALVKSKDTWRKELAEAAAFDSVRESSILMTTRAFADALCRRERVWVFGSEADLAHYPQLAALERVARWGQAVVWRSVAPSLDQPRPACGSP